MAELHNAYMDVPTEGIDVLSKVVACKLVFVSPSRVPRDAVILVVVCRVVGVAAGVELALPPGRMVLMSTFLEA